MNLRFGTGFILLLLGIISGAYFLLPGYMTAATDGIYYTTLAWLVKDILANAQLPMWSNWGDMGFPLMQFYNPLFFALVDRVVCDEGGCRPGINLAIITAIGLI
jgi:hypothetical protein